MLKPFRSIAILAIFLTSALCFAETVLFKIDEKGRKVFYNNPPKVKRTEGGAEVALGYSNKFAQYSDLIQTICNRHGVDPELVKAVIQVESNYNDRAVSHAGAMGLMQLMPATAARYGVVSIFEPAQNIEGGVRYLKDLLQLFDNDIRLTAAAYNAGENRVIRINDVPNFLETQNYVRKVLALYNGEMKYTPFAGGPGRIKTATYYKWVDSKGVTHYSTKAVANATKVSFAYSW
jgi:soluble lytic murein transglycosylase-like protein